MLEDLVDLGAKAGAQDDDRDLDAGRAEFDSLVERGHAEHRDAGLDGAPRDLHGAVAVGVRLHDEHDPAPRADRGLDGREVPAEAIEIDFNPGGKFHNGAGVRPTTSNTRPPPKQARRLDFAGDDL